MRRCRAAAAVSAALLRTDSERVTRVSQIDRS